MKAFFQKTHSEKQIWNQKNNKLCLDIYDAFSLYEEVPLEEKVQWKGIGILD